VNGKMSLSVTDAPAAGLDELYVQFGPSIYARCRQILGNAAAAEDATQEVFLRIHGQLARMNGTRAAIAWLYRVATNYCLNQIRNNRTRAQIVGTLPIPNAPNAEDRLSERDLVLRVARDLAGPLTETAWLYHVDGLQQAEIAEICGVSQRTVISRLNKFVQRARAWMSKE